VCIAACGAAPHRSVEAEAHNQMSDTCTCVCLYVYVCVSVCVCVCVCECVCAYKCFVCHVCCRPWSDDREDIVYCVINLVRCVCMKKGMCFTTSIVVWRPSELCVHEEETVQNWQ
jgi:hypothetical protein